MPDPVPAPRGAVGAPAEPSRLDPRLKILLLLAGSFAIQYLPAAYLPLAPVLMSGFFLFREMRTEAAVRMARGGFFFALFWLAVMIAASAGEKGGLGSALLAALPFTARLASLSIAGIAFARLSPPVETGRAVAWFARPFAGNRAWRIGLALALVAWYLPTILRLAGDVRTAMRARRLKPTWRQQARLIPGTALRLMGKKADALALGLASRKLDDDRAWTRRENARPPLG